MGLSNHTAAIDKNKNLWVWGNNRNNQIGDGTTVQKNSPVQVLTGVKSVSGGAGHTLAIKEDGTLWAWGANGYGQLGDGTTVKKTSPVQVSLSDVILLMDQEPLVKKIQKYLVSTVDGLFHFKDSVWSLIE